MQDHAAAGLGAGVVSVLCMQPLDLLKVKLQVSTERPQGGVGTQIWNSLKDIKTQQGWGGLYRGVGPNIAGNASSWGLYFLLCVLLHSEGFTGCISRTVIICSRNARLGMTPIIACLPGRIFFALHKQVRSHLSARVSITR